MTIDAGLKPEGAPERSPIAGAGAPSGVDAGPRRYSCSSRRPSLLSKFRPWALTPWIGDPGFFVMRTVQRPQPEALKTIRSGQPGHELGRRGRSNRLSS